MLIYDFDRIFKARAIQRPFAFLKRYGFSSEFSSRVKQNRIKRLNLDTLEKLCIILNCTPNDLLDWKDDQEYDVEKNHPIRKITKSGDVSDLHKTIYSIPLDKIGEIQELINSKLGEDED